MILKGNGFKTNPNAAATSDSVIQTSKPSATLLNYLPDQVNPKGGDEGHCTFILE